MSSTIFYITLIVSVIVCVFGRNIQRQVDNLERRYENDYVSIRENLRDLWQHINQLKTTCSSNSETSTANPTAKHHPAQLKNSADKNTLPTYVSYIVKGVYDEKEFLRKNINDLTGSIATVNTTFSNTLKETMKYVHDMDAKCERVADDVEKLHHNNDLLSEKVERLEQTMRAEIDGLQIVINEALEEVMQNSALNNPGSCVDMVKAGITSSGVYTLHYKMQPFIVYCMIGKSGGYTFISPETYINVDIKRLSNDNSHVIIRHRRTNGLQYESRIEQISRYKSRPLSVQYNAHAGYTDVVNNKMTPYIYLGLTPLKLENGRSHRGDSQGYKSNGKDFTFANCGGNPNGYFAFLFNHNKVSTSGKGESPASSRKWIESSTRVTGTVLPDKFMSFFELHFGGCGAYAGTNHIREVTGAAIGIPYTLT